MKGRDQHRDMIGQSSHAQVLLDSGRLVLDRIRKQRRGLLDEIGQPLRARTQQLQESMKCGSVLQLETERSERAEPPSDYHRVTKL